MAEWRTTKLKTAFGYSPPETTLISEDKTASLPVLCVSVSPIADSLGSMPCVLSSQQSVAVRY
jgi:hypothetical protein